MQCLEKVFKPRDLVHIFVVLQPQTIYFIGILCDRPTQSSV